VTVDERMGDKNATADASRSLFLRGIAGVFKGAEYEVRLGQQVTIGRSRLCEFSAARTPECERIGRDALESNRSYRKISRRHFRIAFLNSDMVEFEDLSTNGTFVNGAKIDRLIINDMRAHEKGILVRFGETEEMKISLVKSSDSETPKPRTGEAPHMPPPPLTRDEIPKTVQEKRPEL
jgi:pSer/pThr/pTyr-binding forkhead associated (FHA) protein